MVQVEAFRKLNLVRVPPVPPVGVEREQDSGATVDPRLLQLVQARPMNDIDVWPAERGAEARDAGNRAGDFRPQLGIQSAHPPLELRRRHHRARRRPAGIGACVFGHMGKELPADDFRPRTALPSA